MAGTRFLSPLRDTACSPNTICAHSSDLRHLVSFLDKPAIGWNELQASTALGEVVGRRAGAGLEDLEGAELVRWG